MLARLSTLIFLAICFTLAAPAAVLAQTELPLLQLSDFRFEGGFRLSAGSFGGSNMNFAEGPLEYNPDTHSIFIVGHSHHQQIAEFNVPEVVNSSQISQLKFAGNPRQVFAPVLSRAPSGNPQNVNTIGGLCLIPGDTGMQLLVNAYEYYDAPGDNTHTSLVIRNPANLASSAVGGYYQFAGAAHTSGWASAIPTEWQTRLGAAYITGSSSGIPIIGRTSVGPSAFLFDAAHFLPGVSTPSPVPTTKLLDFSLQHPLHADLSNNSGTNDLWTHLSRAVYGFIAPGTRTYVTLGHSGGHSSGVCYKCTQSNGNVCGGYCAPDADDYYQYYWFWDLNDLLAVQAGTKQAHQVRPYDYGIFPVPFSSNTLGGGSFDPISGKLYLSVQRADRLQGQYANPPIIAVYKLNPQTGPGRPRAPVDFDGDGRSDFTIIRGDQQAYWFTLYSASQQIEVLPWGLRSHDLFLDIDANADRRSDRNATRVRADAGNIGWFSLLSPSSLPSLAYWGLASDIPVSGDFDGDAASDLAIFRPNSGTWWVAASTGGYLVQQWGLSGDYPVPADYDGDRKTDFAIWRPELGMWAIALSSKNYSTAAGDALWKQWGLPGDHPMPGDYDGDGKADIAVWRESSGVWYVCTSSSGFDCSHPTVQQFGLPGDIPVSADFDGDQRNDFAVWRPSNGTWYWKQSSDGAIHTRQWGLFGDYPVGAGIKTRMAQGPR